MRVRLDRYEARNRSMQMRTVLQFIGGGLVLVFAAFGLFLGIGMAFMPDQAENAWWAHRGAIFMSVFFGIIPGIIGALLVWNGVRQRALYRRLGELAAVARTSSQLSSPQLAQALAIPPLAAEKLIVEASTLGLIEDGPPAWAPTPPAPQANAGAYGPPPSPPPIAPTIATAPTTPAGDVQAPSGVPQSGFLPAGTVLAGTYRIEQLLGSGGMGAVYGARHLRTGRRYAVKTILAGPLANEAAIKRFEREATAASALGHPNIVQVHDFNTAQGGVFFLVMDFLEGETLAQRLARAGAIPWPEAQKIALELCSGLSAAHAHGLLHRDIKPSNVFLARSTGAPERSVLVDFGLVKSMENASSALTSTGAVIGTPMYMSPEQARGETLDVRADLYSLAAVVFETLTGAPPFTDRTMAAIYAKLLHEPAPRASQVAHKPVPRAVDDVLARALAKDRAARFADVKSFADALSQIDGGGLSEDAPSTARMVS